MTWTNNIVQIPRILQFQRISWNSSQSFTISTWNSSLIWIITPCVSDYYFRVCTFIKILRTQCAIRILWLTQTIHPNSWRQVLECIFASQSLLKSVITFFSLLWRDFIIIYINSIPAGAILIFVSWPPSLFLKLAFWWHKEDSVALLLILVISSLNYKKTYVDCNKKQSKSHSIQESFIVLFFQRCFLNNLSCSLNSYWYCMTLKPCTI